MEGMVNKKDKASSAKKKKKVSSAKKVKLDLNCYWITKELNLTLFLTISSLLMS